MLIKLYEENPNPQQIQKIVDILRKDGVIIYPTDTVYGVGCDIFSRKAIERVAQIKNADVKKDHFSFICSDLSQLSCFTKPLDNKTFKLIRRNLPGPFTFILPASNQVPKLLLSKKKTVGIRIPDNNIIREIVRELGNPIITTSVIDDDELIEYTTDPELIHEKYINTVNIVIDGGYGNNIPSTVVDCTKNPFAIVREGIGKIQY